MRRKILCVTQVLFFIAIFAVPGMGGSRKDVEKKSAPTSVDSGTFGISVHGKRVASEVFHVDQQADGSTISSELRFDDSNIKAVQSSEMALQPNGLLKKYTWKEVEPGKSQIVVEPQDEQFMVTHIFESAGAVPKDSVHPLSAATAILDDNFFSHMEVMVWKYMAFGCQNNAQGRTECNWRPLRIPVFVPHEQESLIVEVSYNGVKKLAVNGKEGDFREFKFKSDNGDCLLWFNEQNKLVRVLIAADNTEVLRD